MINFNYLLSLNIFTPIVFGIIVLLCGKSNTWARIFSVVGALLTLIFSCIIFLDFSIIAHGVQFVENIPWITSLNINYHLGVDGISMPLVVLNSFITLVVVIAGLNTIKTKVALYNSMFLVMTGFMSGAFCALDAVLFYVFFEAMLIPMYLIIGVWGGTNRVYAALKFFLYTLLGSLLMLIAIIYLYYVGNKSFEIFSYYNIQLARLPQILLFIAFFFAFAVKVPMWPVHTWLPDAHPEAPTGGSMVLAAITLKLGGYGFFRFMLPIVPNMCRELAPLMITLSLIAIVYIGLVAIVQKDMKKLIAYSSISHMGFVTLPCFLFVGGTLDPMALQGALIQMISHGFIAAGLFMAVGILHHRLHSRNIADFGGVVTKMPIFAVFFMLFAMANSGLPGTSGFVGEFMVIMGAVKVNFVYAFFATFTLILGASYTLWMYKRVVFGTVTNSHVSHIHDLDFIEFIVLFLLGVMVIGLGIYPELFVSKIHVGVNDLIGILTVSR